MVNKITNQQAMQFLQQNEEQNCYAILRLLQNGISECLCCGTSICLWDSKYNKYCFAVQSAAELRELYAVIQTRAGQLVSLVSDSCWLKEIAALGRNIQTMVCTQLRAETPTGITSVPEEIRFGELNEAAAAWILTVYEHPELSIEYILRRARSAPAIVAYQGDTPVGFFITHSEAELGPVYIKPFLRGSGLADALYAEMLQRIPINKPLPLLFVLAENQISRRWLLRMGCVPTHRQVVWFWRE